MAPKVAKTPKTDASKKAPVNPEKKIIDQIGKVFYRMFLQSHDQLSMLLTDNDIKLQVAEGYEHLDDYYAAKDRAKESRKKKDDKAKDEKKPKEKRKPLRKLITMPAEFKYRLYLLLKDFCNEVKTYLNDKNCPNMKSLKSYDDYFAAIKEIVKGEYTSTIYGIHMIKAKATLHEFDDTDTEFAKYLKPIVKSYNTCNFNESIIDGLIKNLVFFYNYLSYSFATANVVSIKNKATSTILISILTSYDLIIGQRFMDRIQIYKIFTTELPDYLQSKRVKKTPAKDKDTKDKDAKDSKDKSTKDSKDTKAKDEAKEDEEDEAEDSGDESYESEPEEESEVENDEE